MKKFKVLVIGTYIWEIIEANSIREAKTKAKVVFARIPSPRFKVTEI